MLDDNLELLADFCVFFFEIMLFIFNLVLKPGSH